MLSSYPLHMHPHSPNEYHPRALACSLSWNKFDEPAAIRLARGMKEQRRLTHLELDCCDITANGALHIAKTISNLPFLTHLSISGDPFSSPFTVIGSIGTVAIASSLWYDTCGIRHLRLVDCKPGTSGTRALAQALLHNSRLETLDLSCTLSSVWLPVEEVRKNQERRKRLDKVLVSLLWR